ncbi:MAG: O-antigen ligase family protein [Candidatus Omnitrophota bacterium]|nr:O-antigen ligase family protein [Candidatus Omnitrophota bacterium]
MQKFIKIVGKINYWSIILLPFSVAIAPGVANTIIGLMIGAFLIEKIIKKEKLCSVSLPIIIFGVFMIIGALTFINTVSIVNSLNGMVKLFKFFFIFLVCSESIKDKEHFKKIAISVACAISLIGIDALWQLFSGKDFIRGNSIQEAIGLPRPTASFPNCNVMGAYLTGLTPLIAGLALFSSRLKNRIFLTSAALIGSIGVYLSLSRGAGLGLFVSILFLSLVRKNKIITSGLILLLLVYPFVMPKNIKEWAKSVNYNPMILLTDEVRMSIYRNTAHMISEHPFIGVGINTFSKNYGKYKTAAAEARMKTPDTIYAHNSFLQLGGEMGLLGLGTFLIFLFFTLKSIWLAFKRNTDPFLKAFCVSVFAAIIAYLINGLTETSLYYARVVMIFWFLIGTGLALNTRLLRPPSTDSQ